MIALLLKETQALAAYWGAFALLGVGTILFSPLSPSSLDSTQSLAWTMRFRQCEAGQGLRRGTRRLFADEEAPPPEPVRPETEACKRAAALQHAIAADEEA